MKISTRWVLLMSLFLLPFGFGASFADDEEPQPTLEVRFFQTAALTSGRTDQYREAPPNADPSDEETPLFGGESEEGWHPVGQVDELIELVKGNVSPAFWERTEGADVMSCGEGCILVRASSGIQSEVAAFLADLESDVCTAVTVDVQAAKLTHEQARGLMVDGKGLVLDTARVERLLGDGTAGPSVTVTTFADSRAAVFSGMQRAHIADYDVEVAQGAKISRPQVAVANLGLAVDVRPVLTPGNRSVRVSLDGFLTSLGTPATANTQDDRVLELPRHAIQVVHTEAMVPAGAWTLIDGETTGEGNDRWVFLLRATPAPHRARPAPKPALAFDAPIQIRSERSETRAYDIGDLGHGVHNRRGSTVHLWPTRYRMPEPPRARGPAAALLRRRVGRSAGQLRRARLLGERLRQHGRRSKRAHARSQPPGGARRHRRAPGSAAQGVHLHDRRRRGGDRASRRARTRAGPRRGVRRHAAAERQRPQGGGRGHRLRRSHPTGQRARHLALRRPQRGDVRTARLVSRGLRGRDRRGRVDREPDRADVPGGHGGSTSSPPCRRGATRRISRFGARARPRRIRFERRKRRTDRWSCPSWTSSAYARARRFRSVARPSSAPRATGRARRSCSSTLSLQQTGR